MSTISVLVVEDNPLVQGAIKKLLEQKRCTVDLAENGLEGLAQFKQKNHYHIVFMDIGLPDLNGSEVTALIRSYEKDKEKSPVPIIGLTASTRKEDLDDAIFYGMNKVLLKPLTAKLVENTLAWLNLSEGKVRKKQIDQPIIPIIDLWPVVEALNVDIESVEKMLKKLVSMLKKDLKKIQNAFSKKDYDTLQFLTHYLKGGASCSGTPRLEQAAAALSIALKDKSKLKQKDVTSAYKVLCREISEVITEYNKCFKKSAPRHQKD